MNQKIKTFGAICLAIFLLSIILYIARQRNKLNSNGRFTIGTTINRQGKFVSVRIIVGNKEYKTNHNTLKYTPLERDGKYFVKFLPSDPDVNEIYWDREAADCISDPPADGWAEMPKCK